MGVLYTDGMTLVPIAVDAMGNMKVEMTATFAGTPPTVAIRDEDRATVLMAVSSVDGVTPCPVFVTAQGQVLIDS